MALYLRGERVQFVFGKNSGLDWVIEAAGAIDVGTELGVVDNAPLTAESVLKAAPDVFLVSTTGLESVGGLDGLLAIPGIAQTPAGEAARVITHPDQYLFGGGPRAGMLLAELVRELHPGTGSEPTARSNDLDIRRLTNETSCPPTRRARCRGLARRRMWE